MPRLIHLNGPPGIGKSTLARMYVEDHTGVLNLDIDQLRCLIGGWRDRFDETGRLVRPIALSMADTHLRAGHDVVMPQFLGRLGEIARFEGVAVRNGATFCEVMLMDDKDRSLERFTRRGDAANSLWHDHVRQVAERNGGRTFLAAMYDRLTEVLEQRPSYVVVPSAPGAISETYDELRTVLARSG